MNLRTFLEKAAKAEASDLHLTVGAPPLLRVNGEIIITDDEALTAEMTHALLTDLLSDAQRAKLEQDRQFCFSRVEPDLGYFRITLYFKRGMLEAAIRVGMLEMKPIEDLGLPSSVAEFTQRPNGLLLITGPTGQGKTTTFNALINYINRERRKKIITVEDPIEYLHRNIRSIVVQQEVYTDCRSFGEALVHILRQDPDVIGVGEMRDLDTIQATFTAAETGHLVLATLHTSDCPQTIFRCVDVFPPHQQNQIRVQLASCLLGMINQRLLPRADRTGRVLAYEIMVAHEGVRNLIRENKVHQLPNLIQTGKGLGMATMDDVVRDFYARGIISYDTALSNVKDPRALRLESPITPGKPPVRRPPDRP